MTRQGRAAGEDVVVVPAMGTKLADAIGPDHRHRHVIWTGIGALRDEHPRAYEGICGVLDEVSEDHPRLRVSVVEG